MQRQCDLTLIDITSKGARMTKEQLNAVVVSCENCHVCGDIPRLSHNGRVWFLECRKEKGPCSNTCVVGQNIIDMAAEWNVRQRDRKITDIFGKMLDISVYRRGCQ